MRQYVIGAILALALCAVSVATSQTAPTAQEKRQTLGELRTKVQTARSNRCRAHYQFEYRIRAMPDSWLRGFIRWTRGRVDYERDRSSRCHTARLWNWYETSGAACVKSKEGAWTSNTGNGYYGGFQADLSFQATYNPEAYRRWGTANNWPIIEQIEMAYNGWRSRGWAPWPNTARMCGLL